MEKRTKSNSRLSLEPIVSCPLVFFIVGRWVRSGADPLASLASFDFATLPGGQALAASTALVEPRSQKRESVCHFCFSVKKVHEK
jgi:hypothetical protein